MTLKVKLLQFGLWLRVLPYQEFTSYEAFIKETYTFLLIFDGNRFRVLKPEAKKWLKDNDIPYRVVGTDGTLRIFGKRNAEIVKRDLVEPLSLSIVVMRWRLEEFLKWCDANGISPISSDRSIKHRPDDTFHLIGAENILLLKMRFTSTSRFKSLYVIE